MEGLAMSRIRTTVVALFLLLVSVPALAEIHPSDRDGWYLGIGFGGGNAGISESDERESGGAGSLRAGYVITPKFGLGFDGNMWFKTVENVEWTFSTYAANVNFYPGGGFALRAGIGGGDAEAAVSSGNQTTSVTESGFGVSGGIGYEIRVGRRWAIGPEVNAAYINLESFDVDFVNLAAAFHFYFIPK
jgi:hypothetical protein